MARSLAPRPRRYVCRVESLSGVPALGGGLGRALRLARRTGRPSREGLRVLAEITPGPMACGSNFQGGG